MILLFLHHYILRKFYIFENLMKVLHVRELHIHLYISYEFGKKKEASL